MLFKKQGNCREAGEIVKYVEDKLDGKKVNPPEVGFGLHKQILGIFVSLLENNSENKELLLDLLNKSSNLSEFDVEVSFVSNKMEKVAEELSYFSTSNMAVVEETTAGMNQVKEAIDNSNSILEEITVKSDNLIETNKENREQIKYVIKIKDTVVSDSDIMAEKIATLEDMSMKVDEMVEGVGSIAEQTNLLALNASIEAARAGEHGRGFAVVAEEIRKLAESTKEKLSDMQSFTENIRQATREGTESVQHTIKSMADMSEKIDSVSRTFEDSVESLESTVNGVTDLASMMQEINASSEEISQAMDTIANDSEKINYMAREVFEDAEMTRNSSSKISDIDVEISKIVGKLISVMNRGTHPIYNEDFIDSLKSAVSAHRKWVEKLGEMIDEGEVKPIQADGSKCAFGHFYHSIEVEHPDLREEWKKVDPIHRELHSKADIIRNHIKSGDMDRARAEFNQTVKLSEDIISLLESMTKKTEGMNQKGDYVFKVNIDKA